MALEDRWAELAEEQKAKVRDCKTPEELLSLAQEEGYTLTDDELEAVAGGFWDDWKCGHTCQTKDDCWTYGLGES